MTDFGVGVWCGIIIGIVLGVWIGNIDLVADRILRKRKREAEG